MTLETASVAMYIAIGLASLLIGVGIFVASIRAGGLFKRFEGTLNEVDMQISTLSTPVVTTLTHVGGIADTADATLARLAAVVSQLENVASGATKTANLIGSTLSGVTSAMKSRSRDQQDGY